MTQATLDGLPVLEEVVDVNGRHWLICSTVPGTPKPNVVLTIRDGVRCFTRWAGSPSQARAIVTEFEITARAFARVPMERRASPTKAMPR